MILNGSENIFPRLSSSNLWYLIVSIPDLCNLTYFYLYCLVQEIFTAGMSVVLFSRLYMSCVPFLLFRYIWIENGMIGFTSLCRMLARFKVFFQARIDLTRPEYCRKLIVKLYVAFSSSYV